MKLISLHGLSKSSLLYIGSGTGAPAFTIAKALEDVGSEHKVLAVEIHPDLVITQRSKETTALKAGHMDVQSNCANVNIDGLAHSIPDDVIYFY